MASSSVVAAATAGVTGVTLAWAVSSTPTPNASAGTSAQVSSQIKADKAAMTQLQQTIAATRDQLSALGGVTIPVAGATGASTAQPTAPGTAAVPGATGSAPPPSAGGGTTGSVGYSGTSGATGTGAAAPATVSAAPGGIASSAGTPVTGGSGTPAPAPVAAPPVAAPPVTSPPATSPPVTSPPPPVTVTTRASGA